MNLYKANFTTIIHCEDDLKAAEIARELAEEDTAFTYEEESIKEILSENDLPPGWKVSYYPVTNAEGSFSEFNIKAILQKNTETFALRKRIQELENEIKELKTQI